MLDKMIKEKNEYKPKIWITYKSAIVLSFSICIAYLSFTVPKRFNENTIFDNIQLILKLSTIVTTFIIFLSWVIEKATYYTSVLPTLHENGFTEKDNIFSGIHQDLPIKVKVALSFGGRETHFLAFCQNPIAKEISKEQFSNLFSGNIYKYLTKANKKKWWIRAGKMISDVTIDHNNIIIEFSAALTIGKFLSSDGRRKFKECLNILHSMFNELKYKKTSNIYITPNVPPEADFTK